MKRVVFPILFLLCTATGCPPPGTTTPGQCSLGCDLAGKVPSATMPPVLTWKGEPVPPPDKRPGRAFLFESPKDPTMYWAVVIDGDQVTARYELPATSLGAFLSPSVPEAPTGSGPVRASVVVKVGGPPRPMHVVVPPPPPPQIEAPTYWLTLACLQDAADARAASGSNASTPPPKTN